MCVAPPWVGASARLTHHQIEMLRRNGTCEVLCVQEDVTAEDAKFINDRIREDYALNWIVDGLPAAEMKIDVRTGELFFDMGFNLGDNEGPRHEIPALNNHYDIVLKCVMSLFAGFGRGR